MYRISAVSALALAAMAGPAFADLTAQEAWDSLEAYMASNGYTMEATETAEGSSLTVTDLAVTMVEEGMSIRLTGPDMTFTENGDGTVALTVPEQYDMEVSFSEEGAAAPEGVVMLGGTYEGFAMTMSGTPDDVAYDFAADRMSLALTGIKDGDETLPADLARAELVAGPVKGTSSIKTADGMITVVQDATYGDLSYDLAFDGSKVGEDGKGMLKGSLTGNAMKATTVMPEGVDLEDIAGALADGLSFDITSTHTGGNMEFSFEDGSDLVRGTLSSTGGEFGMAMDQSNMTFAMSMLGQAVNVMVPDMPFPVEGKFGEFGLSFDMPLAKSEEPVPAGLSLLMADFEMADMLWNIFDPAQVLPRDPATIGANIEAQVTPFISVVNEDEIAAVEMGQMMPGELNGVTLSDLVISAVGASLTGQGDFTFDNEDLDSFDGMPRPEGTLNLQVSGLNGLIDKLIQMGLVQEQDAMGARMMLGMFTVPGADPDTATSVIEVNAQGHVLANGQRIK